MSPGRRACAQLSRKKLQVLRRPRVSVRDQHSLVQRKALTARVTPFRRQYRRYGRRRDTTLYGIQGVNEKREGYGLPTPRVRICPKYSDHVLGHSFVTTCRHGGKRLRMLTVVDEYGCECLATVWGRYLRSGDAIEALGGVARGGLD